MTDAMLLSVMWMGGALFALLGLIEAGFVMFVADVFGQGAFIVWESIVLTSFLAVAIAAWFVAISWRARLNDASPFVRATEPAWWSEMPPADELPKPRTFT